VWNTYATADVQMTAEDVLKLAPNVLTNRQRESYLENGYLLVENAVDSTWLARLRAATDKMVECSREVSASDEIWDLEEGHNADTPKLRRLSSPNDHHPEYWAFASSTALLNIVADLIGPDIKFHHSKLNFKWSGGGEEVKWHQDIGFWPHTNFSPCTLGLYLYDCGESQGPLGVIQKSHTGPLYDQYDHSGEWVGHLSNRDLASIDEGDMIYLPGPAGSLTIHNCRTIHGSQVNHSPRPRPLLLNVYSATDAMPYTHNPLYSKYAGSIVRGKAAQWARHDPGLCLIPPDWSGGYTSIFSLQQEEIGRAN